MRATTLLNTVLGIKFTLVKWVEFTDTGLVCDVEPTTTAPRCGGCFCRVPEMHDRRKTRCWRHLDRAGMTLTLRYAPRRVRCPRCGVTTELVPWAAPMSWFRHAFEQTVGYLAKEASKTVVSTIDARPRGRRSARSSAAWSTGCFPTIRSTDSRTSASTSCLTASTTST